MAHRPELCGEQLRLAGDEYPGDPVGLGGEGRVDKCNGGAGKYPKSFFYFQNFISFFYTYYLLDATSKCWLFAFISNSYQLKMT